MDLANKLSGLDMYLYNAEDSPCPPQSGLNGGDNVRGHRGSVSSNAHAQGPKQPGEDTFDEKKRPHVSAGGMAIGDIDVNGADDRERDGEGDWEVVPKHPDWDVVGRGGKGRERKLSLKADWVVCEKGRNGKVQMFEGPRVEDGDTALSASSEERARMTDTSLLESTTRPGVRVSAKPSPAHASYILDGDLDSHHARARELEDSHPASSDHGTANVSRVDLVPSRKSYERTRPGRKIRPPASPSTTLGDEARKHEQELQPALSSPLRVSATRRPKHPAANPTKNRPLPPDEQDLPFLSPSPPPPPPLVPPPKTVATNKDILGGPHDHEQVPAVSRVLAKGDQDSVALIAAQERLDEKLQQRDQRGIHSRHEEWRDTVPSWPPRFYY
ncbi:hypothetical protein Z517_04103 [Fonsecaea pedrosoi CBS 271.37]|uniref:Uncharacterized protein n=1 Tax=Fonsecaea pedrosoi CBS 271.37 TaxID=1442368 RepID=A0A0D2GRA1_9EURO|nr:uncharacterized protein Z517_04103 [Fonsecaea pedrosoi CBS 271.37]KIW81080.1 hypothetical protein Z517_04103 [Fonsecaea pedrosoi CBS 271.37]